MAVSEPAARQPSGTIKVVVVEDDESIRQILCDLLRAEPGFECLGDFESTEAALPELPRLAPAVALVDINLPGLNGIECVRRLKPQMPETQFMMLTVYDDSTHIFDALAAGATGYLLKRTARETLLQSVREIHGGGSPMSGDIARKVVQSLQQARPTTPAADGLSPREDEVLGLLARGYLYKEIADKLGVSMPTVKTYIRRIYEKLHVHSRAQAVARYANLPLK